MDNKPIAGTNKAPLDKSIEQDTPLIPRFGKIADQEEYSVLKSLASEKQDCLARELTGLLGECVKCDCFVDYVAEILECMGYLPSGMTGQLKFLQIIEKAKRGDAYSRTFVHFWEKASLLLSQGTYEHPAIRKYRYSVYLEKKKPRYQDPELDARNRQIAQLIYQQRKVTSLISYNPFISSCPIDQIEALDESTLNNSFFDDFNINDYPSFQGTNFPKRIIQCKKWKELSYTEKTQRLSPDNIKKIYRKHRRSLIVMDFILFALLRALTP
jgi:hypothetical protein